MRGVWVLVGCMLAGCASTEPARQNSPEPCVADALHVDRASFAWGERANLTLRLANCGDAPVDLPRGQGCYPEALPRLEGGGEWTFLPGDPHPHRRPSGNCSTFLRLAPNESRELSWAWDGQVYDDRAGCQGSGCEALVPFPSGNASFLSSLSVADQGFANVSWKAPVTCARLTVTPDRASFGANETMTARVKLANCGDATLPLASLPSCAGAAALQATLTGWNGTWTDDERGGPRRDTFPYSHGYCLGSFGMVRATVDPSASFAQDVAWDGKLRTTDLCPTENGAGFTNCDHTLVAPAGDYELRVEYAGPDGALVDATAQVAWSG